MSADIPLYLWESFIAVIEERTLQRAADKLNTTQPTITRHLHQLEESLPLKLFELRGRIKEPTPFAEDIYRKINPRLKSLPEDVRKSLHAFTDNEEHVELSIAAAPQLLRGLSGLRFKGRLRLDSLVAAEDLRTRLKEARNEILISFEGIETSQYLLRKLSTESFMLVIPKKFLKGPLSIEEWKKKAHQFPRCSHSALRNQFIMAEESRTNFECADWNILEERAAQGLGWTILPTTFVKANRPYSFKSLPQLSADSQQRFLYVRKDIARRSWGKALVSDVISLLIAR